jgi:hypothetical protein
MSAVDPFVPLREWRTSLYRGDPIAVDRFLASIDTTLLTGWVRELEYERKRLRPDQIRCYLYDRAGDAVVRVWLQLVTATRVRGGPVQLLHQSPSSGTERVGQLVAEFADACVLPAARSASIQCTRPAFGPRSAITPSAEMLFAQLADTADGKWPLADQPQLLWDELISNCLAEHVAIDRIELEEWLADSGWKQEAVPSIVERFFSDSEWFAKRLAVTSQ